MQAVVIDEGALRFEERPDPSPGEGQLLVRVEAAGVNGADLAQRRGQYPAPPGAPADIPGLECAGVVVAVGPGVSRHGVGDRVMGIAGGGGQAELAILDDEVALRVPEALPSLEAGAFPEVFTTAHDALFAQCGLSRGERLLVTGAAGGVGLAAVQLAKAAGASVTASVRSDELRTRVAAFGAERAISPDEEESSGPYDVVIELVGAASLAAHLQALSTGGRIAIIGVGADSRTEIDLRQLMTRRAVLRGSTLRARSRPEKAATARAIEQDALSWLAGGVIRVPVETTFAMKDAEEAYNRFEKGGKLGKIVLANESR